MTFSKGNLKDFGDFRGTSPNFLVDIYGVLLIARTEFENFEDFRQNPLQINQNLLQFLKEKTTQGSKVAIISNVAQYSFEKEFWGKLTEVEREIFDQIVLSGNEGFIKPDPKIFEITLERLGENPENCIFIDDSPTNVEAARQLGMNGIIYQNFNQFEQEMEELCQNYQR